MNDVITSLPRRYYSASTAPMSIRCAQRGKFNRRLDDARNHLFNGGRTGQPHIEQSSVEQFKVAPVLVVLFNAQSVANKSVGISQWIIN